MRVINLMFILLITIILCSFCFGAFSRSKLDIVSDKLIVKVGKMFCKKHNMNMVGIGGGAPTGKLENISVSFDICNGPLNKDECRRLMVECKQAYLDEFNASEEIRPFLITYPLKPGNIFLTFIINNPDGSVVLDPNICAVSSYKRTITYSTCTSIRSPYKSTIEEPYEEALAKIYPQIAPKADMQIFTDFEINH